MKWLDNISVRGKLLIITLPLAFSLLFSVIFMAVEISGVEEEMTDIYYDTLYTVNSSLINADRDFYQSMKGAMQYYDFANGFTSAPPEFAVTQLPGALDDYTSNKQQVYDNVRMAADAARANDELYNDVKSADGTSFSQEVGTFEKDMKAWESSFDLESNSGDWEAFHDTFSEARNSLNNMQEITEAWAVEEHKVIIKEIQGKVIGIAAFFGILMVVLTVIVVLVIRGIRLGIKNVTENLDELAMGNLTLSFPDDSQIGRDDIGHITRSAKQLTAKLRDIMSQSRDMSEEVTATSTDLADSASQSSQASEQVTDAVTEISKGAVSQAESVENAVSDTDEIGKNIENISGAVSEMDRYAEEMKEACDKAMNALDKLIRQSEEVTASVKDIGDTINSTNDSAKSISEFTQAITDIATQTNLLSLNASIEAARAGDAGRGFAVVADEIRQLADQSSDSADKIKSIVEKLLADSASSVSVLEKLNESFSVQAEQLDSTKSNMESMSGNVASVKNTSSTISKQVSSLNDAKNGLMEIISDLSAISEENAASTEETNASMEELNATFTIISESAGKLQGLAEELKSNISYFRV
ncbi:MAG: methyl-accepting chemotaxis protein [Lachnospiraceae bacterium]|nr:methyl-accepting chemotaxis protein [Lachnospiraceae bacterium]